MTMIALVLASFAVGVPELPRSAYVDTEASTNFPIAVEDDGKHWMTFVVSLAESPSNNVEVAVGTDADGNGVLGVDEADWAIGYDCGRWFTRKMENGEWRELRMENGEWKAESEGKGAFHLLPSTLNSGQRKFVLTSKGLDARWNLARVTRRGLGVSAEQVIVKCKLQGTCVFVK